MARGMQCLHAISNYMRKVELKYQHVLPPPYIVCLSCVTITGDLLMITAVYYYEESKQRNTWQHIYTQDTGYDIM